MGTFGKMQKVKSQLKGQKPRDIAFWFLDRSVILLKESQVPKEEVIKYIEECY